MVDKELVIIPTNQAPHRRAAGGTGSSAAADITITDAADNFAADNVEDALTELADDIAGASGATNLAWDASTSKVTSDTGTDATLTAVDGSNPGLMTVAQKTKLDGIESGATADMTAAEILAALLTVDGSGSGLDADLLDGNSSAAFATAGHNHTGTYEPAGNLATHEADTTSVHGITDTSTLYRSGGTDVAVGDGGTGSSTAAGARTNLDVYDTATTIGLAVALG